MSTFDFADIASLMNRPARVPSGRSIIARPRVIEAIDTGATSALCIVRGPRNQGKSVALSQWAQQTSREILWLHLSRESATPDVFWQQLRIALTPKMVRRTGSTTGSDASLIAQTAARSLAFEINGSAPFTLILEDFHWLHDAAVQSGLIELLEHSPGLNIIVSARAPLNIESDYAAYDTDFHVVGPAVLQFTAAEATDYHAGTHLETVSDALNRRLDGSPILHKAAKIAMAQSHRFTVDLVEDIVQKLVEALREQTNARLMLPHDRVLRDFMAATTQLQYFDRAVAQALFPTEQGLEAIIGKLVEAGALRATPHQGTVRYSYPPIIGDILAAALDAEIASCRERTLDMAADMELVRGDYLLAFNYAVTAGNYRFATNVILHSGLDLLFQEPVLFAQVLTTIPHSRIINYPLLALALGLIYNSDKSTRGKGSEYFNLAVAASESPSRSITAQERMALNMAQAMALRLTGNFKLSAATARKGLADRSELPLENRDELTAFESAALSQWALSLIYTGDYTGATTALHQAVSTGQSAGAQRSVFFATSLLAYRYAIDGDLATAAEFTAAVRPYIEGAPGTEAYLQTPLHLTLAMIDIGNLQPDSALDHLRNVMSETSTSEFWGRIRIVEAQIDLLRRSSGIATARLDLVMAKTIELPPLNPLDAAGLTMVRSALLLARGNVTGVATISGKSATVKASNRIAQARLSLSLNRPADVVKILSPVKSPETSLLGLHTLILRTVARLHLQEAATLRADIEMVAGAIMTLKNQWPVALLPKTELELLMSAWRELGIPEVVAPRPIDARIPDELSKITLTPREASILVTLASVSDRSEMARRHFVSVNTIKSQLRSLYKKLGVGNRDDALLVAHQQHLLDN